MSDTNDFREWMDARGLKAEEIAPKFDVSPQTISHWRSQGVPERRKAHVNYIMSSMGTPEPAAPSIRQTLILQPTPEQFRTWNLAAISQDKPMLMEEWAVQGLDHLAAEWEGKLRIAQETAADREERWLRENSPKVAEGEK